ncbi:RNA polymerase sigma-70 factor [Microbacterium lushaniae]|uniref:RNA polymerase sigma-70 factor n=1 Tax=Microbacterium lushaniae TaxID=2614639 RepID=A0A5J6L4M2_9MICO|nr:RNA polymerase sigma-70 factor [Microbacterium lushaniae]QEW03484.1 RNA polymerase sigma-70 factor [Microbacterium lushaniae]
MDDTPRAQETTEARTPTDVFAAERRRLFGIAYRMLGSVADAEDILQEVWLRWERTDRGVVREPAAFLTTVTTRLCINEMQSARARRETYIGPWLPEPVNTEDDPALGAERGEALQFAVLLLLENLTPTERAAYVLREALDYPYDKIAEIVRSNVTSARQLVSRARRHLAEGRRIPAPAPDQRRLLEAFLTAARGGDVAALEKLFTEDVVSYTDGNGVKLAARIPVHGRGRVAKFVAAFSSHFWTGKTVGWVQVNGQPAATLSEGGEVTTIVTITSAGAGIAQLLWVMSPDKLRHVVPAGA